MPIKKKTTTKTPKPLWNLYRDGLTQSSLNLFLACREQFRLKYVEGWEPHGVSEAISFGECFHELLSEVHTGTPMKSAIQHYYNRERKGLTGKSLDTFNIRVGMADLLLERYFAKYGKEDAKKTWLHREEIFKATVPGSSTSVSPAIPITGRWDGVYRLGKGKNAELWIHETKTKANIDETGIQQTLSLDTQTMLYSLAVREKYGVEPAGVVYDVIRRPGLKQGSNTLKEYINRIEEDVDERPKWYFMRWTVEFLKGDLDRWVDRQLRPMVNQVRIWWDSIEADPFNPWGSPHHFINKDSLLSHYGSHSEYFDLITKGDPTGLYRRKKPFAEL